MNTIHARARIRRGFSLIELLVVIGIIGVLVSLLSAAVMRSISRAEQAKNANDIGQIAIGLENFKNKFGFYPPSRIQLYSDPASYKAAPVTQLKTDSLNYLTQMFPRWSKGGVPAGNPATVWAINPSVADGAILEGDQCLVFFLAGQIDTSAGTAVVNGFGNNPRCPTDTTGGRIGPFYEFDPKRLVLATKAFAGHGNGYASYVDAYGLVPFAYFSSYKTRNGYNRYDAAGNQAATAAVATSDCALLGANNTGAPATNLFPYATTTASTGLPSYQKPESFQILSAGRDYTFGPGSNFSAPGTLYWPTSANYLNKGNDDQSNFATTLLAAGQ